MPPDCRENTGVKSSFFRAAATLAFELEHAAPGPNQGKKQKGRRLYRDGFPGSGKVWAVCILRSLARLVCLLVAAAILTPHGTYDVACCKMFAARRNRLSDPRAMSLVYQQIRVSNIVERVMTGRQQ